MHDPWLVCVCVHGGASFHFHRGSASFHFHLGSCEAALLISGRIAAPCMPIAFQALSFSHHLAMQYSARQVRGAA